ncbi:hypothetical protein MRQ36_05095 [Micromonospora sp. R77]|uniref:hypothetical protein n=1 Tax=Micromonospora sp. R77 TaxID=2925836 RepID=UPI001F617A81|nr:hypothetical protein [Micromonospora sp. R77]MCI4061972.1 hypothetical protein [Micromonospora sp. R77]
MFDLLVLGGLGVDIRAQVPGLPLPAVDSLPVPPIDLRIGNTGAGVALAAHALGLRVALVDVLGADPAGAVVRTALARTSVHAVLVDAPAGTRRSVNLVDPDGRRMSLYDPRPWQGRRRSRRPSWPRWSGRRPTSMSRSWTGRATSCRRCAPRSPPG